MTRRTILLADDSEFIINLYSLMLEEGGYQVVVARDGIEAIAKIHESPPDLILLDLNMPRMNGYQVCRLVKADPATREIPVVILTSRVQRGDRYWGIASGADEYLTKDVDVEVVIARIREHLELAPPTTRTPARARPTDVQILESVNALFDRKLFQLTILGELVTLGREAMDLGVAVKRVGELMGNILNYVFLLLRLEGGAKPQLFCYSPGTFSSGYSQQRHCDWLDRFSVALGLEPDGDHDVEVAFGAAAPAAFPGQLTMGHRSNIVVAGRSIGQAGVVVEEGVELSADRVETIELFMMGMGLVLNGILAQNRTV